MTHNDPYGDDELAALYDLAHAGYDDDLALYEQFAVRGETPVLDLAAGSGRVALHLARHGQRVVAVDASRPMLARLEAALGDDTRQNITCVEADIRSLQLGQKFDLVCIALNSLEQMLTNDDVLATLDAVARHLTDGGVFVAELRMLRAVDWSAGDDAPLTYEWTREDPATGQPIIKLSSIRASAATQSTTATLIFDRVAKDGTLRRRMFDVTLRVFGRHEIELLLRQAGLRLAACYGGYDLSPLTDDSDTMILVAELEGA